MPITLNESLPDIHCVTTEHSDLHFKTLKGKNIVLYFYPKDNTPGCTKESIAFRDHYKAFLKHNTLIIGVSRDSLTSHQNFICKYELPFPLISDSNETLCKLFDVIRMKNMYGKQVQGIERSTFLIDEKSILRKEWRKVKVESHVEEVLDAVKNLA